jgi:hypothetical protein
MWELAPAPMWHQAYEPRTSEPGSPAASDRRLNIEAFILPLLLSKEREGV